MSQRQVWKLLRMLEIPPKQRFGGRCLSTLAKEAWGRRVRLPPTNPRAGVHLVRLRQKIVFCPRGSGGVGGSRPPIRSGVPGSAQEHSEARCSGAPLSAPKRSGGREPPAPFCSPPEHREQTQILLSCGRFLQIPDVSWRMDASIRGTAIQTDGVGAWGFASRLLFRSRTFRGIRRLPDRHHYHAVNARFTQLNLAQYLPLSLNFIACDYQNRVVLWSPFISGLFNPGLWLPDVVLSAFPVGRGLRGYNHLLYSLNQKIETRFSIYFMFSRTKVPHGLANHELKGIPPRHWYHVGQGPEARKHVGKIVAESVLYCKQRGDPWHEFILLQVTNPDDKQTNLLLLDRTDPENDLARIKVTRLNSSLSKPSAIEARLLVSYYGDKQSLLAMLKPLNQEWRKEVFHRFNLFELADIFFDARHHITLFYTALDLAKISNKTSDCTQNDLSLSAVEFLHCLEQGDSPVNYMQIDRVSTHVISALYCKDSGPYEHEFIRLMVANEVNPSVTGYIVLDRTVLDRTLAIDQPPSTPSSAKSILLGLLPALDRFTISSHAGQPPVLRNKATAFQVVERLEFKFGACSLYRLVILAAAVASTRPNYQLLSAQCYWFASTIWECVQSLDPSAIHVLIVPSIRGRRVFFHQKATSSGDRRGREVKAEVERHKEEIENQRKESLRLQEEHEILAREQEEMRLEIARLRWETENVGRLDQAIGEQKEESLRPQLDANGLARKQEERAEPVRPSRKGRDTLGPASPYLHEKSARENTVDPEVYKIPRNHDIFPTGLGSYAKGQEALEQPLPYTLIQLKSLLQRSNREGHTERIYVASVEYCKRLDHVKHEFLLLEVRDNQIPQISNFVVLERTIDLSSGTITAASTIISSNNPARDRLIISYYGEKKLLIKQCNLGRYEVLEELKLPSPAASTPLLLYEFVILAHETSKRRYSYNLVKAQCFWFASCVWECMLKLRPEAHRTPFPASNNRGRFGTFRQVVDSLEIGEIFDKTEVEIKQFLKELTPERKETESQGSKIQRPSAK
ncbi:hypothetical protein BDV93DRAFT_516213 [Ceratobasidium sp. AG-I]|nr:hypothetical protein BDV93DRAFT_516213 [Ceratobasidium sp. AG-I]